MHSGGERDGPVDRGSFHYPQSMGCLQIGRGHVIEHTPMDRFEEIRRPGLARPDSGEDRQEPSSCFLISNRTVRRGDLNMSLRRKQEWGKRCDAVKTWNGNRQKKRENKLNAFFEFLRTVCVIQSN